MCSIVLREMLYCVLYHVSTMLAAQTSHQRGDGSTQHPLRVERPNLAAAHPGLESQIRNLPEVENAPNKQFGSDDDADPAKPFTLLTKAVIFHSIIDF